MSRDLKMNAHSKATKKVAFFFGRPLRVLLCVLVLAGLAQGAWAEGWRVAVEKVLDGDTLVLAGGERLRLRGIDAPEASRKGQPGQYFAGESARILSAFVSGRDIVLDRSELDTDRYGRLVGVARLTDGRQVNGLMIEAGAAFAYPHSSDRDKRLALVLLAAQREAMAQGRGFWPGLLASPMARAGFVGTKNSRRFHAMSCAQGRTISAANRVYFSSLRDAFEAGYAPARECTPWPLESGR